MLILCLCGCKSAEDAVDVAMALRQNILSANSCQFDAAVTADYGDCIYRFKMSCITNKTGQMQFEVIEPTSISGITGSVDAQSSQLTFDGKILAFSPLADGQITPVCAPWVFIHTLRSGYINACGRNDHGYMLNINDSYREDALELSIQLDAEGIPVLAQIYWQDRRVLSVEIENFMLS